MTLSGDCEELRTQKTILEQKKLRLDNSVQGHEKEIRQLEVAKKNLDAEMKKLNTLFYKNTDMQEKLKNDNFNIETLKETDKIKSNYENILNLLGENKDRDGLLKTPERAAKAISFLTEGYDKNPHKILQSAMFKESYSEMVIVKDIELYSLCEHHLLPFFGKAHIAYIPNGHIVGLSKLPRVVDIFSRRLQVQERLTEQILDCINDTLSPKGVAVVIEASHMCMMMRGVQKQNSSTTTSGFRGAFKETDTRNEFLNLIL